GYSGRARGGRQIPGLGRGTRHLPRGQILLGRTLAHRQQLLAAQILKEIIRLVMRLDAAVFACHYGGGAQHVGQLADVTRPLTLAE
ncbi:MAG: hypothetical protein ACRETH_03130, partial [Steroidobacteraceae bacterium]